MTLNTIAVSILALICYFVLPLMILIFVKNYKSVKKITFALLIIYIVILVIGVWTRVDVTRNVVKISLDYSYGFFNKSIRWGFSNLKIFDILVNLVMLMPIGLSLVILKKEPFITLLIKSVILGFIVGFIVELGQYILPIYRAIQLSDVIFNMISLVFGTIIGKIFLIITKRGGIEWLKTLTPLEKIKMLWYNNKRME